MIDDRKFKWSMAYIGNDLSHHWTIGLHEYNQKKFTFYYIDNGNIIPIRSIATPFCLGHDYVTTIGLVDDKWTSLMVNTNEIKDISDIRNNKLNQLMPVE